MFEISTNSNKLPIKEPWETLEENKKITKKIKK